MKFRGLKSFFKVLEPVSLYQGRKKTEGKLLCQRNGFALKLMTEFYVGTQSKSVKFLKKRLYVVTNHSFEIVNLDTLHTSNSIPDVNDGTRYDFLDKREGCRPVAMFRTNQEEYLVCYNEVAFYVSNSGKRSRPDFLMEWEGRPTDIALYYPYVVAFDPSFIEIRHVETGSLEQVIVCNGLKCLSNGENTGVIYCVMRPKHATHQCVFQLDLPSWQTSPFRNSEVFDSYMLKIYDTP
ncbi:RHO1 GDP-GTP exchange protein 2 [Basidiobolus ranarum]|uniref:RHO1 GDP-GTP exchange protein 2 n=1 Tax=Basidiobolus ranarum TaxID=34480 RepID=A0ABR2VPZ8_9FUNG